MNQCILAGKQLVPRLAVGFNSLGAIDIFQILSKKFLPEYQELAKAQNFSIDDPEAFSENQFEKIFDTKKVGEYFYDKSLKLCCIDLKVLIQDKTGLFTQNNGWIDITKSLNTAIDELSFIFLQCFKTQYERKNILSECQVSFSEIQEFINKKLVERFKDKQKQSYIDLTKNLKFYVNGCIEAKFNIQSLILGLQQQSIKMENWKEHIEASYGYFKQELNEKLNFNKYQVSKVLLYKYSKKMRFHFLSFTLQYLAPFQQYYPFINEIKEFIESQFQEYFVGKQLMDGVCDSTINKQLQYLIYSIGWIQSSAEADEALLLLKELSKYSVNVIQSESQIFRRQQFSSNLLIKYKYNNKDRCQQAKYWWNENINESQNIKIIFQIFIISVGLQFNQGLLQIPSYSPAKRNMLTQVLRVLNNGKFDQFNFDILKICEMLFYNIYFKILQQFEIQSKTNNYKLKEIDEQIIEINLFKKQLQFRIDSNKKIGDSFLLEYYQRNHLFKFIISQNAPNVEALQQTQGQIIKDFMQEIKKNNSNILEIPPPKELCFQLLSKSEHHSNIVTLCIAGFLSSNEDKNTQWQEFINKESGIVISLHWDCKQIEDFCKQLLEQLPAFATRATLAIIASIAKLLTFSPYEDANQEAIKVGQYLAFLIAEYRLFGDCQINLVCHSLGSQIVLECIKVLDKLYGKYKQQYIQEIIFLGGVADTRKLQKRRWNAVAGRIYNIYSKKDAVLTYILFIAKLFDKPCGLQPVYLGYKQVINFDFTKIVNGHNDYYPNLKQILLISDFNNDLKSFVSGIIEEQNI